jgi:hypothetical protein
MTPFLAIDPGASGGLAWRDADGIVHAEPMPDGMTAQVDRLRSLNEPQAKTINNPGQAALRSVIP